MTCENKGAEHQDEATFLDKMGGSTEVVTAAARKSKTSGRSRGGARKGKPTASLGYCWTHGSSKNGNHTSMTCQNKDPNHQDEATVDKKMGGSTEDKAVPTTLPAIMPYCWTHGSSRNHRHSSMTCINKHADHQDEATFLDKMGGSTEINQGTRPSDANTPRSYCWTHGFSKNVSHTSMTCIKKHDDHQKGATATDKMGGSDLHEDEGQLHQTLEQ
jgi:hypothetical protein